MSASRNALRSFDEALGRTRGRQRSDDQPPRPVTPRDRAREFCAWLQTEGRRLQTDRLSYLREERETAAELGLLIEHGFWERLERSAGEPTTGLAFIYDSASSDYIGIVETVPPDGLQLFLIDEDRAPR